MRMTSLDKSDQVTVKGNANNAPTEFIPISEYIEKEAAKAGRSKDTYDESFETNVLFVGEVNSGKTSLINLCLGSKGKGSRLKRKSKQPTTQVETDIIDLISYSISS